MERLAHVHSQSRPGVNRPGDIHGNRRQARHGLSAPNRWGLTPGEVVKSDWGWTRWRWLPQPRTAIPYSAKHQLRISKPAGSGVSSSFRDWRSSNNPFLTMLSKPRDVDEAAVQANRAGYLSDADKYVVPGWARNLATDLTKMETKLEDVIKQLNRKDDVDGRPTSETFLNKWLKTARQVPIPETETTLVRISRPSSRESSSGTMIIKRKDLRTQRPTRVGQGCSPRTPPRQTASEPSTYREEESTTSKVEPPMHLVLQPMQEELAAMRKAYDKLYAQLLGREKRTAAQPSDEPDLESSPDAPRTPKEKPAPESPPPIQPSTRYFREEVERLELEKKLCEKKEKRQQRIIDHLLEQVNYWKGIVNPPASADNSNMPDNSADTTANSALLTVNKVRQPNTGAAGMQPAVVAGDKALEQRLRELLGLHQARNTAVTTDGQASQDPNTSAASTEHVGDTTIASTYSSSATQTVNVGTRAEAQPEGSNTTAPAPTTESVIATAKQQIHQAFRSLRLKTWQFSNSAAFQLDGPMVFVTDLQKTSGQKPFCQPEFWDRLNREQRAHRICQLIFVWLWRQILRPGVESFGVKAAYDLANPEEGFRKLEVEMGLAGLNAPRLNPQQVAPQKANATPLQMLSRATAPIGERIFRTLSPVIQFEFSRNEQIVRQQIWTICHDAALLKMMFRQVPEKQMKVEVPGVHGDQAVNSKWGEQGFDNLTRALPFGEWVRVIDIERAPGKREIICVPFGALTLVENEKKVVLERAWIVRNGDHQSTAGAFVVSSPEEKKGRREEERGADPRADQGNQNNTQGDTAAEENTQEKPIEKESTSEKQQPGREERTVIKEESDAEKKSIEQEKPKETDLPVAVPSRTHANPSAITVTDDEGTSEVSSEHDDLKKDPTWRPSGKPVAPSTANTQDAATATVDSGKASTAISNSQRLPAANRSAYDPQLQLPPTAYSTYTPTTTLGYQQGTHQTMSHFQQTPNINEPIYNPQLQPPAAGNEQNRTLLPPQQYNSQLLAHPAHPSYRPQLAPPPPKQTPQRPTTVIERQQSTYAPEGYPLRYLTANQPQANPRPLVLPPATQAAHRSGVVTGSERRGAVIPGTSSTALADVANPDGQKKRKKRRRHRKESDPNWVPRPGEEESGTESSTERDDPGGKKKRKASGGRRFH